ncbi:MAG: hypothetical protein HYT98_00450 [Candidatus Sungbacteria bacterium]|nr:hypothetical protein [Candidatus Sungbacteria bacterium]
MLSDSIQKVKSWRESNKSDLYVAVIIFLTALASFGLGRLSAIWPEKEPIVLDENLELRTKNQDKNLDLKTENLEKLSSKFSDLSSAQKRYVASKSGTAYHFSWCPGALRIKEENKIWFETKEEAEKAGYKPAGNCEGL